MKVPKNILKLIEARTRHADELNTIDAQIRQWLKDNDINSSKLEAENGCMITTEPYQYAKMTIELIESEGE